MEEGRKDDSEKLPWGLLPFDALNEIVKVLLFGKTKYGARNWERGMDWNRPFDALMRHMTAWWQREDRDQETGTSHLANAGCCLLFLLAYEIRGIGRDNRPHPLHEVSDKVTIPEDLDEEFAEGTTHRIATDIIDGRPTS